MKSDLKPLEIPLNGKLNTELDGSELTLADYKELINMGYTETGIRGIKGQTKANTTATGDANGRLIVRGHHFKKDFPSESHVLVQVQNTAGTDSEIYNHTAIVPAQGNYTALEASPGATPGTFSNMPDGCVGFCNGTVNKVWGGNEYRCAGFINFNPDGSFKYDYTTQVNNTINDASNQAILKRVTETIDANTMLLLSLNNNVTDTSPTTVHTVTNTNGTFSTTAVFGTHQLVLNGTTAYLSIPDNADFSFTGGAFTIDARINVDLLTSANPIYYQKTDVLSLAYTVGITEPAVGNEIEGNTSGAKGIVDYVPAPTAGTWAGGDAEGTIYFHTKTGTFQAETLKNNTVVSANFATIAADSSDAGDNYIRLAVETTGALSLTIHECYGAGSDVVTFSTPASTITIATNYHIELVESANDWYIFVNGKLRGSTSDASRARNYIGTVYIGYDGTYFYDGKIDEYRVSNVARHTATFIPPLISYGSTYVTYVNVRATRPLRGVKFYVATANTSTATVSGWEWDGSALSELTLTDNTATSGKTLAKTGSITFDDTQSTSKANVLYEGIAYTYTFLFVGIDQNTAIYYCTVDAAWQPFTDIWDGIHRIIGACRFDDNSAGTLLDYSTNVFQDTYTASVTSTYATLGAMTSSDELLFGFTERVCAIPLRFVPGAENVNPAVMSLSYYNGAGYTTITDFTDGTTKSGCTAGQSGTVSWNPIAENTEFATELSNDLSLYYYKIKVSATLSATVNLFYAAGFPVQKQITGYKFPVMWQNRPILLNKTNQAKNRILIGSYNTVCVFNGFDSWEFDIGDSQELTAGIPFFTRVSGDMYESILVTKKNESWILDGIGPSDYRVWRVSETHGCPAPETMRSCDTGIEIAPGIYKNVKIWRSSSEIVMFDGSNILPISDDIKNLFDPDFATSADPGEITNDVGAYDKNNMRYHWFFTDITGVRQEWVYNLKYKKWFQIERTSTKRLACAWSVVDLNGSSYVYGGDDLGYTYRLEYGTDFDGQDIVYSFSKPDFFPLGSTLVESEIRNLQLIVKAKNTTSNSIELTSYPNTISTGEEMSDKTVDDATHRLKIIKWSGTSKGPSLMHSVSFSMTTDDETVGFEPLYLSGWIETVRRGD